MWKLEISTLLNECKGQCCTNLVVIKGFHEDNVRFYDKQKQMYFCLFSLYSYIFWTEFGANPRIERANLDGSERKAIVTTGLVYPNDLQIDFNAGRLYWIDAYTDRVESSKFDGTDRRVMTYFGGLLMHPYSMALFANHSLVYFTDWYRSWVFFKDLTSGSTINVLNRPPMRVLEIGQVRVLHESNQPSGL